jgi:uncharacterized protein YkwD
VTCIGCSDDGNNKLGFLNGNDDTSNDDVSDDTGDDDGADDQVTTPADVDCGGSWDVGATQFEADVLAIVNQRRAEGANCGGKPMPKASGLSLNAALTCAARLHSKDMSDRGFFSHNNPDGESPFDRMLSAGYRHSTAGENIAQGQSTPEQVMQTWMDSPGHCSNIMSGNFVNIGVGYFSGEQRPHFWTQTFGSPR